jgi:hypothetical protein
MCIGSEMLPGGTATRLRTAVGHLRVLRHLQLHHVHLPALARGRHSSSCAVVSCLRACSGAAAAGTSAYVDCLVMVSGCNHRRQGTGDAVWGQLRLLLHCFDTQGCAQETVLLQPILQHNNVRVGDVPDGQCTHMYTADALKMGGTPLTPRTASATGPSAARDG